MAKRKKLEALLGLPDCTITSVNLSRIVQDSSDWVQLPLAPTTNNLFINGRGGGRICSPNYRDWKLIAAGSLVGVTRVSNYPVCVTIAIREGKGWRSNSDVANREKATIDALVESGVLAGDSTKYVHRVVSEFWPSADKSRSVAMFVKIETIQPIEERV